MDYIDLRDPAVRARVEELGAHAEHDIVVAFISQHPELLNVSAQVDVENRQVIEAIMAEQGLPLSPENLERAYQAALEAGQLQFAMYHPQEIAAFDQMSTKQMARYLTARYQAPRPDNAADLLPQFGERTWGNETPTMDEEACAALREKLLRQIK